MPPRKLERGAVRLSPEDLILLQRGGPAVVTPAQSQATLAARAVDRTAQAGQHQLSAGVDQAGRTLAAVPVRPQYDPTATPGAGLSGLSRPGVVREATMTLDQKTADMVRQMDEMRRQIDEFVKANPDPAKRPARVATRGSMPKGK